MSRAQWSAVDRYLTEMMAPPARLQGARNILEMGTLGGYSTIWLGRNGFAIARVTGARERS